MNRFTSTLPQISSRQRQTKRSFETAKSVDELLKAFKDMETCFDEKDLGMVIWDVGYKLNEAIGDPEKVLSFGSRALRIMVANDTGRTSLTSMSIVGVLGLLGSVCFKLNRFEECLSYFNWADRMLTKLQGDDSCRYSDKLILTKWRDIQLELFNVKNVMGKREDGVLHLRKVCEIVEKISEKDSEELAKANRQASDCYMAVSNLKEALHFCLKALDIYRNVFGDNTEEVAECRKQLVIIYCGVGEYEKSLEHSELSQRVFKNLDCSSLLLLAEIEYAHTLKQLGRYEEAVETMRRAISRTAKQGQDRIMVLIFMAETLCCQEKFPEAEKYAKMVCGVLDMNETSTPLLVAVVFGKVATVYETMNELETALSLLKRVEVIVKKLPLGLSHSDLENISERIGMLLVLTGKAEEAVPYLEDVVKKMKERFGSKHYTVGYAYCKLGSNYYEMKKMQLYAQCFAYAKDIFDESLGPLHPDTIQVCKSLSGAYASMRSYSLAISIPEMFIERAKEAQGPDAQQLVQAADVIEKLKAKATTDNISTSLTKVAFDYHSQR